MAEVTAGATAGVMAVAGAMAVARVGEFLAAMAGVGSMARAMACMGVAVATRGMVAAASVAE